MQNMPGMMPAPSLQEMAAQQKAQEWIRRRRVALFSFRDGAFPIFALRFVLPHRNGPPEDRGFVYINGALLCSPSADLVMQVAVDNGLKPYEDPDTPQQVEEEQPPEPEPPTGIETARR